MLKISKTANANYLARIIRIEKIRKHPNADSLQLVTVDFQDVVTGMDAKVGDIYVYFPVECQINLDFLRETNSFSSELLNADATKKGFFDKNGRVKAVKLRGEYSLGYIVPLHIVASFTGTFGNIEDIIGNEFDTIGDILMVKKYEIKKKEIGQNIPKGKKPRISRLVEGQVHLHVSTENLRKEAYKIHQDDRISISYKLHGTSGWCSFVKVKRKLNLLEKILKHFVKIETEEYDLVYGSRKVVKNEYETQGKMDFYKEDLWGKVKDEFKEFIPKSFTLYYEIVGYTEGGAYIQEGYDYGCEVGKNETYIYRITTTNSDGVVNNLSTEQIIEFCNHFGLKHVPYLFIGKASHVIANSETFNSDLVEVLEDMYTEKDCYMCKNKVPEEGIVVRKEKMFQFEAYKLKSNKFLEYETKLLDKGVSDLESDN